MKSKQERKAPPIRGRGSPPVCYFVRIASIRTGVRIHGPWRDPFTRLDPIGAAASPTACVSTLWSSALSARRVTRAGSQVEVELSHHLEGQSGPPVQDLGDPPRRSKDWEQVPAGQPLLLHAKLNLMALTGSDFGKGARARSQLWASMASTSAFAASGLPASADHRRLISASTAS